MFYTVTVCECCGSTDVHPDYDQELSGIEYSEQECNECAFLASDLPIYMALDLESDHCAHVLEYQCADTPF